MHALQLGTADFYIPDICKNISLNFFQALFSLLLIKQCSLLQRSLSYSLLYLQFTYMIFIYLQSFIHHSTGLFGTNIMISFQLACQLSWQSTALVSQRSRVHIPYRPEFFSFRSCFTTGYLSSVNYCKDHFHIHFFVCCSNIRFSCIHSHLLYLQNTRSSLHVLKISLLSQEFCHSFQLQIN